MGLKNVLTSRVYISCFNLLKVVGIGYIDANGRQMSVAEFNDNDTFSNLEALVVQLSPRECLIPSGDLGPDGAKLKQVC